MLIVKDIQHTFNSGNEYFNEFVKLYIDSYYYFITKSS